MGTAGVGEGMGQPALSGGCVGMVRTGSAAPGFPRAPGCAVLVSHKVWAPSPPGPETRGHPSAPVRGKRRALGQLGWGKSSAARTCLGVLFLNAPLTPCRARARGSGGGGILNSSYFPTANTDLTGPL